MFIESSPVLNKFSETATTPCYDIIYNGKATIIAKTGKKSPGKKKKKQEKARKSKKTHL